MRLSVPASAALRGLAAVAALATFASAPLAASDVARQVFIIRGQAQYLYHVVAPGEARARTPILFIPGDGGWRGSAVTMARMLSSLSYDVYGLDVRRYLKTSSRGGTRLTGNQMASDLDQALAEIGSRSHRPAIRVGWSQGAAMVVLAAARTRHREAHGGVLTIALPESGFLAWRWRDSFFALLGRDAREPIFEVTPLLPEVSPVPAWMIYGTRDRFTPASAARRMASLARRPRRRREIKDGDHGLRGHRDELRSSLRSGLAWIERQDAAAQRRAAAGSY